MPYRWLAPVVLLAVLGPPGVLRAQTNAPAPGKGADLELVEKVIAGRQDYQKSLEQLRLFYLRAGDVQKAQWVEEELLAFHRAPKHAFILDLDVPPPNLRGESNIPEANVLFTRAMEYKRQTGFFSMGESFIDNQRRQEILLREIITKYPQSTKISAAAFYLGEIYESKAYKHYRRAAAFYERSFQWNPNTDLPGRMRAARLYDRELQERGRAMELYREVLSHEHDPNLIAEANRRLKEMGARAK